MSLSLMIQAVLDNCGYLLALIYGIEQAVLLKVCSATHDVTEANKKMMKVLAFTCL